MARLVEGHYDHFRSINAQTHQKQSGNFVRWSKFLERSGINNKFLDEYEDRTKNDIVSAYLASIRRNENGRSTKTRLKGNTVSAALNHVCATFRSNFRRDPTLDLSGNRALQIQRQIRGYKKVDGSINHQKCLPLQVFNTIYQNKSSQRDSTLGELITGALFFGMRSCEYSVVKQERKTKLLILRNIQFFTNFKKVPRVHGNKKLLEAETVSITFISQKNNEKDHTVSMHKNKTSLCPVKIWASIVLRILSYPDSSLDLPVCTYRSKIRTSLIQSKEILEHIRTTVKVLGEQTLGFKAAEVGCHSIRSSFAMFLYIQQIRTDRIMLQGRWKSDAFLLYIRPQVAAFSKGLSEAIIHDTNNFFTVPEANNGQTHTNPHLFNLDVVTNPEDPRNRNANSYASHLNNNGPGANNPRVTRPTFFHLHT